MKGGVDLPLPCLPLLEVTQAHTQWLAGGDKSGQVQSDEG